MYLTETIEEEQILLDIIETEAHVDLKTDFEKMPDYKSDKKKGVMDLKWILKC